MYGGDEVNAIVIDVGSSTVKAGYAGEDTPKAFYPSQVGFINRPAEGDQPMDSNDPEQKRKRKREDLLVGLAALNYRRDYLELEPSLKQGLYDNLDYISALWHHAFHERLRCNPEEHPMLLAEPTFNTKELREKTVQLMFEEYGAPAVFLAKNAVLSSFATGRQTSLSVDSGHEGTVVAAVHDGYVLQKSITRGPLGGALLTQCMLKSVEARGSKVRPRFAFKKTEIGPGQFEVHDVELAHTTASFRDFAVEQIAADLKEVVCRVSDTSFNEEENANIPTVTYELPDGQEIQIGPDRFKVPEVLFQPDLHTTFAGLQTVTNYDGSPLTSMTGMVMSSINKCDVDVRRELFSGIVLTGGNSLFTQVRDRLERELAEEAPQIAKVKVLSPPNATERKFSVWIGGSILASLGSFQQMWMSKQEYEEHGPQLIHRKSP